MTHGIFKIFRALVVTAGGAAMALALAGLLHQQLDYRYLLLLVAMATVASRLSISIPLREYEQERGIPSSGPASEPC